MPAAKACPFCQLPKKRIWVETSESVAFLDGYPVSPGHSLVIPKTHVASIFDLSAKQRADLWRLVEKVRKELLKKFNPEAFNIGVNDGLAAGQTVPHAHIHVIPRRAGDVKDPRGGIRWVISGKAKYW